VNDVSGIPSIDVDANGTVSLVAYGGNVAIGSTGLTGTASQKLQVSGGGYVSGSLGIAVTNPSYPLSVVSGGSTSTSGLTNAIADFTSYVNLYSQVNIRNSFSGSNASSDLVVTADTGTDSTNYLDMGINNSGFSTTTWSVNGATDGYLYTSNTNLSVGVATTGKYLSFFVGGTLISNEQMRVTTSGIGIGTTNPTSNLHVQGNGYFNGTLSATQFTSLSDINKKKNIRPIKNAIDITKKLEGVRFNWIDNDEPSIGVIAQDVEKVLPELVVESGGTKSVSYGNIIGVLIEAIKEQQVRIEELEEKLNA
jgi:hypothetical protein